ncbi:hypothetical protein NLJ89_g2834 [Agrocybe chaxingu]|uniref:Uncharacterized protein n=1 Tax=Agrocybe chaxingu TaxID=84603 RepID=A0A9W8MXD5_9AGAR|nr:hypothetical protein NLJ89_g2834 [Agrocybe chaxingu]
MKSFFSRLHDSQTGHSKSASRETYKFWTPNADAERNAARTVATSVETERPPLEIRPPSRGQKLSHFYRKPTHEKPLPTTYTSTPAEKTSASSSRPNPGSSSTHVYAQPPPKASSSRHPDVRDVKPQANTYSYTGLVQPQSTNYPNPTPAVQHELWIPPSAVQSMSRPGENKRPPSRSHEKYTAHERYRSRDEEREAPRESGRRDRDKKERRRTREQERGRDSDREGRREREGDRNRDREREREEKDRLRQLEREQEYAKEAEREKELKEKAKERERRQLEKERERQEEKERQEQEEKERERREQEKERERRAQERERERREQEKERERREQEKERERREQEKERERMEQEKEREQREQEKEQEQEKERERRERREKERNRHVERERREGDREMARGYHREKPRRDVERDGRRERENDVNNGSPGKKDRLREGETTHQRDTGEGRASRDHRKRDRERDDTRYRAEATDGEDLMISRATRDKRQETGSGWVTDNQVNHGYKPSRQTQGTAPTQASRQNIVELPKKIHKAPSRSEPPLVAQSQTSRPPIREPLRALQRDPLISEASQPVLNDPLLPPQPGHSQSNPIESQVVDEGESSDGSLKPVPLSKRTRTNDTGAQNLKAARSRQDRASRFMPPYNSSNQPQIASHEKPPVPATPRHMPVHLPPREARTIERAYQQSTTLPSTMENKIPDSAARREINRLRLHSRPEDLPVVPAEGVKALEPPLRPPSRTFGSSQNFVSPQMTVPYTPGANSASQLQQAQVPFEAQPRTTGAALSKIVKGAAQPQASSVAPQTLGASELAPSLPPSNVLGGSSQENRLPKTDAAISMDVPTVQSTPLKPSINLEHGAYLGSDAHHPSSSTSFRESSTKTPGPYQPATPTQLPTNVFDLQSTVEHPNVSLPTNVPEGLDASSREPFSSNSSISRDNAAALPSNWDVRPHLAVPSDDRARSGRQDTTGMSISKSGTVTGFKQDAAKLGRILGHLPSISTNIAPQLDKVQSSTFIRTAIGANTVDTTTETEGLGHSPCFPSTTSVQIPDAAQTVASMVGAKHMHVAIAPQMDSAKDGPSHVASTTFQGNSKPMKQSTGYFVLPSNEPSGAPATRLVNDNTNRSTDNVVLQLPTPSSMKQEGFRELPRVEATPTQPHATFAASVDGPAHRSPGFRPSQEDSPRRVHVEQPSPRAVLQAAITPEVVPNPVRQGSGSKKDSPSWVSHSAIPNTESNPPMVRVPSNIPIISPSPRLNIYRTIPPSGSHATIDGTHQALSVGVRPQLAAQSDSSVWQSSTRLYTSTENADSSGQPRQEATRNTSTTIHSSDNYKPSNEATSPPANKRLSTAAHMLTGRHALDRPSTTPHNVTPSTVHTGAPSGGQAYPGMNDSQQQLSTGVPKAEVVIEQGRLQKTSDTDLLRSARPSLQPLPASLVRSARPSIQPLPSVTTQKHPYSNFASFQPSTTLSAHPQIHHPVLAEILSSPPLSKPFSIAQSGSTSRQHEVNHPSLEHHRSNTPVVNQVSISTRHPGHPFERVQIEDNQENRPSISKTPNFQNAFSNFQGKDVPSSQSGLDTTALMTNQVKLSPVQPPTIAPSTNTRPHQDSIRSSYGIMANIHSSTHAPQVPSGTWAPYPEGYASKTSLQPGVPSSATPYTQTFPSTISSHHPSRHQHSASLPINLTHPPAMNSSSSRTRTGPTVTQASQVQPSAPLPPTVEPTARNTLPDQVNATSSLPRTASEETILMTPSSLAQSMMLKPTTSRQSIAPSISSQTRKRVSLLSMFRKPPAPPPQPQPQPQPYEIWHPGTSNPESYSRYRSENAETFDRRYMSPVHRTSSADRNLSASNPSRTEKKSNKTDVFTPFRFLASKKNRSVSVASMEAQDGTAPSTVVGSPTTSIHSQVPFQIPSVRDPQRATEEWRDREEAGTKTRTKHKRRHPPGVVFDVSEETPENQQRQRYRGSRSRKLADNH